MTQEELKKINEEIQAILDKNKVSLQIVQAINIVPNVQMVETPVTSETTGTYEKEA